MQRWPSSPRAGVGKADRPHPLVPGETPAGAGSTRAARRRARVRATQARVGPRARSLGRPPLPLAAYGAAPPAIVAGVPTWQWLLIAVGFTFAAYALFVVALVVAGRRGDARAVATFIPDCLVLFQALLRDPRVPRRKKALLVGLIAYLAMPFDLVPDFIPVAGQLDDAIIVAFVIRSVLRAGGPELVRELWRGPQRSLDAILRLAYGRAA